MNLPPSSPAPFLNEAQALSCVHCGICLGSCPTYLETGNENDSPRGRIYLMRALQAGRLPLADTAVHHLDLCLGCRACETACPSGVPYGQLLETTREHIEHHHRRPFFQRILRKLLIEKIFPFPHRMKLALLPARVVRLLHAESWLPRFARDALALVPQHWRSTPVPTVSPTPIQPRRGRVGMLDGCVMQVLFGATNLQTVRLLNHAGYDVVTPPTQGCCGALYAHSGNLEAARAAARHNLATFESLDLDAVIINAAGCGSTLKEYGHLLHDDPVWAARAQSFSAKVKDLSEWLRPEDFKSNNSESPPFTAVTYHDACHLAHAQRLTRPPRALVRAVAGKKFVELPEADVCCGSAGSYNLTEPEMAARLQRRKIDNILRTGADLVITTNPGCLLQIQAGLRSAGATHVRVQHLAEFLTDHLNRSTPA